MYHDVSSIVSIVAWAATAEPGTQHPGHPVNPSADSPGGLNAAESE